MTTVLLSILAALVAVFLAQRYAPAVIAAIIRATCRHADLTLSTTGAASIDSGAVIFTVVMSAVEIRCQRCGEFWHADLDASEALAVTSGAEVPKRESALRLA